MKVAFGSLHGVLTVQSVFFLCRLTLIVWMLVCECRYYTYMYVHICVCKYSACEAHSSFNCSSRKMDGRQAIYTENVQSCTGWGKRKTIEIYCVAYTFISYPLHMYIYIFIGYTYSVYECVQNISLYFSLKFFSYICSGFFFKFYLFVLQN